MIRIDGWAAALGAYLRKAETLPFVWGERDCCLFASDAVLAMTGADHGEEFRGKYKTAKGALGVLKKHGGPQGIADAALGERVPALMLQRGDLALINSGYGDALGVVSLDGRSVIAIQEHGTGAIPVADAKYGWRV